MSNWDDCLCLLPCRKTLYIYHTILCNDIVSVGSCVSNDRTLYKSRTDTWVNYALLVGESWRAADKALSTVWHICTENEIKLSAGTTDVLCAWALWADLSEEVKVYTVIDWDEIVKCGNILDIICVAYRGTHELRILIEVIVHLLGSGTEAVSLTITVDVFLCSCDFSGLCDVDECVNVHLCVYTEILEVWLSDEWAYCVWHSADTELETGTVWNLVNDKLCNLLVYICCRTTGTKLSDCRVVTLNNVRNLWNMYIGLWTAVTARHVFIDLNDDFLWSLAYSTEVRCVRTKVEVSVWIHRCNLEHSDIVRCCWISIITRKLWVTDWWVERTASLDKLSLITAHMPWVPCEMLAGILTLENGKWLKQNTTTYIDILKFICSSGKCLVEGIRCACAPAVVNPVAWFDNLYCLICWDKFLLVLF